MSVVRIRLIIQTYPTSGDALVDSARQVHGKRRYNSRESITSITLKPGTTAGALRELWRAWRQRNDA